MGFVYLALVIVLLTTQNVVRKAYSKNNEGVYFFNAISAFCAMLVFLVTAGGKLNFKLEILPYSLIFATFFAICSVSMLNAIKIGSLTLSSLISSYSLIIPYLIRINLSKRKNGHILLSGHCPFTYFPILG